MPQIQTPDKTYSVPLKTIEFIKGVLVSHPTGNGVRRAKFIVKNGVLSLLELKRLKNFFDHFNSQTSDKTQYNLAGGDSMRSFVETELAKYRAGNKREKEIKRDMTANPNSELMPYKPQIPSVNENIYSSENSGLKENVYGSENKGLIKENKGDLNKNAVAVIVNNDNKILLLKRSDEPKQWMPSKWALVGGAIEKGETPEKACEREIKEETGLEIKDFIKSFTIQRHPNSIETIFACRYEGEPTDVVLNEENTSYGWFDTIEMKFLDTVPHLVEYITLVFKSYE